MAFETKFNPSLTPTHVPTPSLDGGAGVPPSSPKPTHAGPPPLMETPERVRQVFRGIFSDVPSPDRRQVYGVIRRKQKRMSPRDAHDIQPSDNFPGVVFTHEEVHRIGREVGKGGYSVVHATVAMTFVPKPDFSPSWPKPMVVKRARDKAKPLYEQEATRLELTLSPGSKKRRTIDHYHGVHETREGLLSIHKRYDRSMSKVEYAGRDRPVSYIIPRLTQAMDGLCAIHRGDPKSVHRDIKGENFLVMDDGLFGDVAALTDFGLLHKVEENPHLTTGTVRYLAPFIFANFDNQAKRLGRQTQPADVFAFGRMIQQDVLAVMLKQIGDAKGISVDDLLKKIKPKIEKFTKEALAFGRAHPESVFYQPMPKGKESFVYIFPTAEEGYTQMEALIDLFKGKLPDAEIDGLKQLATLAKEMQNVDPDQIPTAESSLSRLSTLRFSLLNQELEPLLDANTEVAIGREDEDPLASLPEEFLPIGEEILVAGSADGSHRALTF